jgi:DNA-binding MarR family transcriptional regulator
MSDAERPHVLAAALVRQAALRIAEQVQGRLQSHQLTHMQWRALALLRDAGISTPTEMAVALGTDNAAMTRLLDRMEVKGLCRRARSSLDRRVVEVKLGSRGAEVLDHTGDLVHQVLAEQFAGATADELTVLQTVLTRLVRRCPDQARNRVVTTTSRPGQGPQHAGSGDVLGSGGSPS